MAEKRKKLKILPLIIIVAVLAGMAYLGRTPYKVVATIQELLAENKELKQALTNLKREDQIGYAKVVSQERRDGKFFTTIKFVETARNDKLKKVLEKDFTIEGDIIHFDALIVKFGDQMVMNGKKKALYLWRRVYSENTAPEKGLIIEEPGKEPERYNDLLTLLPVKKKDLFWTSIWELANDPEKLREYDIEAVYSNVVYSRLKEGFIYVFKITATGQLYPETTMKR